MAEERSAVSDAKKWLLDILDKKKPIKRSEVHSMGEVNGLVGKDLNKAFRQLCEERATIRTREGGWKLKRSAST